MFPRWTCGQGLAVGEPGDEVPVQVRLGVAENRVVHPRAIRHTSDRTGRVSGILQEVCSSLGVQVFQLLFVVHQNQDAPAREPCVAVEPKGRAP